MENTPVITVIDVPLFDGNIPDFFHIFQQIFSEKDKSNKQVSFCDANVLVTSKNNAQLKEILTKKTYLNMPDGMPGVWIGRLKGAKRIDRCYGPDVFEYIIKHTSTNSKIKHFFTGGNKGVAEHLRNLCKRDFGNSNIVGVHCPPFSEISEDEIKDIATLINSKNVDVVWVGISSPKQDIYAHRLSKYLSVHFIFTVGAAFDFFTGKVKQAPIFIQRSGFEWLFRLIMEPKRLWRRYIIVVPSFILYSIKDYFAFILKRLVKSLAAFI